MTMVNCREASRLASIAFDRALSPGERIRLGIHRALCAPCRVYKRQLQVMREVALRLRDSPLSTDGAKLPEDSRARLRAGLQAVRGQQE